MGIENGEPKPRDFREEFKKSLQYPKLLKRTSDFLETHPHIATDTDPFILGFTGKLFEELAYLKHRDAVVAGDFLLDPQKTEEFFNGLYSRYPHSRTGLSEFGSGYIPDGIIVRSTPKGNRIVKVLEYSTKMENSHRKQYVLKKARRLSVLAEHRSRIVDTVNLEIVFPQGGEFSDDFKSRLEDWVTLGSVPYSLEEVEQFAHELAKEHFPPHLKLAQELEAKQ